ncbi:MAG: GNAT family N-acetyltransferase [Anaerolineae bacterium]
MIVIRLANTDDAPAIARVHIDTWHTTYRGLVPAEFLAQLSYERSEQKWRELLSNPDQTPFVHVAEKEGVIVGFASSGPEREQDPVYHGELYAIYVLDSHQRQGVGRNLVRATARQLWENSFSSMLVWVLAKNPSRAFYERLGGRYLREKLITIGGVALPEVAYGWPDIRFLISEGE